MMSPCMAGVKAGACIQKTATTFYRMGRINPTLVNSFCLDQKGQSHNIGVRCLNHFTAVDLMDSPLGQKVEKLLIREATYQN